MSYTFTAYIRIASILQLSNTTRILCPTLSHDLSEIIVSGKRKKAKRTSLFTSTIQTSSCRTLLKTSKNVPRTYTAVTLLFSILTDTTLGMKIATTSIDIVAKSDTAYTSFRFVSSTLTKTIYRTFVPSVLLSPTSATTLKSILSASPRETISIKLYIRTSDMVSASVSYR